MFPWWDLLYNSICSGLFQKNYFNILQLMYDIWMQILHSWCTEISCMTQNSSSHFKFMVLQWYFMMGKKTPNKPNKSPNFKALHYKFSFFYKFSLTSGDLPSLYWVSMNKLRRQVACWIRSIYKANLKLFQQSCSDACGAWYSLCWSQRYIHISGRL